MTPNWAFTCHETDGGGQITAQKEKLTNEVIAGLDIAGLVVASLLNVLLRQQQLKKQPK